MLLSKRTKTGNIFLRVISIILIQTFLLSGVAMAAPQDTAPASVNSSKEVVTNPDSIVIPREFGLVKSKFKSENDRLVIHIQDAHCNYEAQSNIARILETLIKNDGLRLVSVEGADGVIDTSWFKAFPDDAVRKEVADYFMKKGEITGPEFLSITTDLPIKLFGAETRSYYIENLNAFTSSYPLKADTEQYFNTIKASLDKLKGFIYSDELRLFDQKNADYESKKLQFNEYVRFLQDEAEKNKINLRQYDNLFKLINVLIYEKKIDFNVTDRERGDLIDELTKKLSKDGITQLVTQSISFKMGKISSADYYNYLKNLSQQLAVDLAKKYPNLYNYIIYNSVYSKIENEKLFGDLKAVETAVKEKVFRNDDQRQLEKLSRHIDILIGLVNIKLLNGDFDYFKARKDEFSDRAFADFIHKKAAQFGLAIEMTPPTDAVAGSISKLEDFYAIAIKRDKALVDNTVSAMEKESQKIAVLVTGGFHSEGIAKLLEKHNISYMVVCPSITKDVPTPYIQVLTNQRTSFEDIIAGAAEPASQAMLAPALISEAVGLTENEVYKLYKDTAIPERVRGVKEWWAARHLSAWMSRAFRFAGSGTHRLTQQEEVMREAYVMALDYRLAAMVRSGNIGAQGAVDVKSAILNSAGFNREFHNAFAGVQAAAARERVTQAGAGSESYDAASRKPGTGPDSEKGKVVGASIANKVIDRALAAEGTKFAMLYGKDKRYPDVPRAEEKYLSLVDDLKSIIKMGIDKSDIEDIIRTISTTGKDPAIIGKLKKAFTKENLLEAFEENYGLRIKLVQPPAQFTGVRVPGIAMLRAGSNYGHYSADANVIYLAWGMTDKLLAEGSSRARRMIAVTMLHELTEMVVLKKMDHTIPVADALSAERIVHDVAERLERLVVGPGSFVDMSALDDKLAEITGEYFKAYSARCLDAAARNFSLDRPVEELYLGNMWRQYIDRHVHNYGSTQLRIIEDPATVYSPGFDPQKDGNFIFASSLELFDRDLAARFRGQIDDRDLAADGANTAAVNDVHLTAFSLDGGIGENAGRLKFLIKKKGPDARMGAKGTDFLYTVKHNKDRTEDVSIAEAKLLQLFEMAEGMRQNAIKFASIRLVPLVNYQSKKSYVELFRSTCFFDRIGDTGKKRTYRDLLMEAGVTVVPDEMMLEQQDLPWIEKSTNDILIEKTTQFGKDRWQPGGHGYWGFRLLYDTWKTVFFNDGKTHVGIFYNGDNLNSSVRPYIAGAMRAKNIPILKLTTPATPLDKKGGKDGVRVRVTKDGIQMIPDQMEVAEPKRTGQLKQFYAEGLKGAKKGRQPFNTNIFYINMTLLHEILTDLERVVGEEEFYRIISPVLLSKDKRIENTATNETAEYAPIDGAIGSAVHHLNEYFLTSEDPRVADILARHKVKDGKLLHFDNVGREQFTPVKKCFDIWMQDYSDYYKGLDTKRWLLEQSDPDLTPTDYDLQDPPYEDTDSKNNYWNEYQNLIDSLGHASTVSLRSLRVMGRVSMSDAKLAGDVVIINKSWTPNRFDANGKKVEEGKPSTLVDLNTKSEMQSFISGGRLVLQNVLIVIEKDLSIKKVLLGELYKKDHKTILETLVTAGVPKDMAEEMILTIPETGAIRLNGGALAGAEHRGENGVNKVIEAKIRNGKAYAVVVAPLRYQKENDEYIPMGQPTGLDTLQLTNLAKVASEAGGLRVSLVILKGLRESLAAVNIAQDMIFHPGAGRRSVYLDEEDLKYLLSLTNGADIILEAINHELAHIENPELTEAEIEKMASSFRVKMALALRDATAENAGKWIGRDDITPQDLEKGPYADMFRDYDYRKTKEGQISPAVAFRLGLTWAKMAIQKANELGIRDRRVLVSIDAREINLENVTAMVSALRYAGLDVIFISSETPNCVSSYSWAHTEHSPLLGIFFTASHVVDKEGKGISGFKVVIKNRESEAQSLTTMEIKNGSSKVLRDFVGPGSISNIAAMKAGVSGSLSLSSIDENLTEMGAIAGRVAASTGIAGVDIYTMSRLLEKNKGLDGNKEEPIRLLRNWLAGKVGDTQPLKGLKVVIEGANTPSGALAAKTFEKLGAGVVLLNGNIVPAVGKHKADPSIEDNLVGLKTKMSEIRADFGMAFDLDGDRGAIIIPTSKSADKEASLQDAYQTLPPDIALVALLPFLKNRAGYDPASRGMMAIVRDVLSTRAVDEMAEKMGIEAYVTDAGYVFLKKKVRDLKDAGYTVPMYGERSGHWWTDVTGSLENPIVSNVLFAVAAKEYAAAHRDSRYPFEDMVKVNRARPYKQSSRFQPLYHKDFLKLLGESALNDTGWVYDGVKTPPQRIIALGRDAVVKAIMEHFKVGGTFETPAGSLKVEDVRTYKDVPEEGGLYRFADIGFSIDGKFAGRFVFRASANDPVFVCSFETPVWDGEDEAAASVNNRYDTVCGIVLDWMEKQKYATASGAEEYVNKKDSAGALGRYRAAVIASKLHTPLAAKTPEMAARFLKGGYKQDGWGVEQGASVDGSFAIDNEGNQGYYTASGRDVFISTVQSMRDFFQRRAEALGKPIRYVIKPGIGGQHTPFQGIAEVFQVIDVKTGVVVGEYELGKDYEAALGEVLKQTGADWDQIAVIPSSKSGSTDETMIVFSELLYTLLKQVAQKDGIDGDIFASTVFKVMHDVNFVNGVERPGKDLFKGFSLDLLADSVAAAIGSKDRSYMLGKVRSVLGTVLGNMFFETTDRPEASRLSAFIRNSGLDAALGRNAPGFGAMFDNVGGRWTADLHMMTFLAYNNLDAEAYWKSRYEGIKQVREGTHVANLVAGKILNEGITDIALVVPDELYWFGKSVEQNFNESIWQKGFANLIAVKESLWKYQAENYAGNPARLVINLSGRNIPKDKFNVADHVFKVPDLKSLPKQEAAVLMGKLTTAFYGITHVVGNNLIARALAAKGYSPADVDMSDLDNEATKIVQENLYLRQPYVELGKGLLEKRLGEIQKAEAAKPGAIRAEMRAIQAEAEKGRTVTNIPELDLAQSTKSAEELAAAIGKARDYAKATGRKFVPFIYLEGEKFYALRDRLITIGIEWVMQGTGDQHISYQQVLSQPQRYLPFIVSFVPEKPAQARPAIGFAKGYLDNVSPNMVRDLFAEASYKALTELRQAEGGKGVFMRMTDSGKNRGAFADAAQIAVNTRPAPPVGSAETQEKMESAMREAAARKVEKGGPAVGDIGAGLAGGKPQPQDLAADTRPMTDREDRIYNEYVRADESVLRSLLISFQAEPAVIEGKTVILLLDEKIVPRTVSQFAEKAVNRYIVGKSKVIIVRGTGKQLFDNLISLRAKELIDGSVVTSATMETINAVGDFNVRDLGKIINIEPEEGTFVSPLALVDAMLRIGYQLPEQQILERLNDIFRRSDGEKITAEDLKKLLDMTNQILRVRPIVRIDPAEIREAYMAAQQALQSL